MVVLTLKLDSLHLCTTELLIWLVARLGIYIVQHREYIQIVITMGGWRKLVCLTVYRRSTTPFAPMLVITLGLRHSILSFKLIFFFNCSLSIDHIWGSESTHSMASEPSLLRAETSKVHYRGRHDTLGFWSTKTCQFPLLHFLNVLIGSILNDWLVFFRW